VHIHGVLFSSWFVLLIVQTSLVAGHRVNWHRRLGQATIGLAALMLVVGFVVSSESLARNFPRGDPKIGIAATNFLGVLIFSILVYFAYRERTNPAAHKRLMFVATVPLLWAAFIRWPVPGIGGDTQGSSICCYSLLFLLAAWMQSLGHLFR
jgi:FtsH-binding integral membrane protein